MKGLFFISALQNKFISMETIILYHKSDFTTPIYAERDEVYTHRNTLYDEHYITVVDAFVFHTS